MKVTVYCGSSMGGDRAFAREARALGSWIADNGHVLVYGGSAVGLMGQLAESVLKRGGRVEGVEPRFFIEAGVAQHDLSELVEVETMSERKAIMIERGDAFVALPGGVGTLEEVSEIMSRVRLKLTDAPCILVNIGGFYDELAALLDKMAACGFLNPHERAAISFVPDAAGATALLAEHARTLCAS